MPPESQTARASVTELPTARSTAPGTRKIPEPITVPMIISTKISHAQHAAKLIGGIRMVLTAKRTAAPVAGSWQGHLQFSSRASWALSIVLCPACHVVGAEVSANPCRYRAANTSGGLPDLLLHCAAKAPVCERSGCVRKPLGSCRAVPLARHRNSRRKRW